MTGDQSWEARMAARARERLEQERRMARPGPERTTNGLPRSQAEALGWKWAASMPLGAAVDYYGRDAEVWACACVGPPYCCRFRVEQAHELKRGAHIVAKLLQSRVESGVGVVPARR